MASQGGIGSLKLDPATSQLEGDKTLPIYFFRFEDLIANPYQIAKEVFAFVLGVPSIDGTYLDYRIKHVMNQGASSNTLYKPRSGSVNSNLSFYTDDQLDYIKRECRDQLLYFGYAQSPKDQSSPTITTTISNSEFFDIGEMSEKETDNHYGFLKSNKNQHLWCQREKETLKNLEFEIEKPGQGFKSMLMEDETSKIFNSIRKTLKVKK